MSPLPPSPLPPAPLPRRGYLGFEVEAVPGETPEARERWVVSEIDAESPADEGTLQIGDEILELDGLIVESLADLRARSGRRQAGDEAHFTVTREGRPLELVLVAAAMPAEKLKRGTLEWGEVPWIWRGETLRARALWTLPSAPPWALLWLLPSATWISQESSLTPSDPNLQLIDDLTAAGIATLRVDRSGLGDSEGPAPRHLDFFAEMTLWQTAWDYYFAREIPGTPPRFLYGRSLGGMLAPLLAQKEGLSGLIVWGTSPKSWHEASLKSFRQQLEQSGATGEHLDQKWTHVRELLEMVYGQDLTPEEAHARSPHLKETLPSEFRGPFIHDRVASFFHQLNHAEVEKAWSNVKCPVLALHAEYDILTQAEDLHALVQATGKNARFLSVPGVDHFMHERASMEDAVRVPFSGAFSPKVTAVFLEFLRSVIDQKKPKVF